MLIGIDASRGFLKKRTGVEEYSYQIVKALIKVDSQNQYILYLNGQENEEVARGIVWPSNFKLKNIPFPRLWVHLALCIAAWRDKLDVLFIPAQAMPIFYPRETVVTLHGLEYEHYPESYSAWRRFYLRWTTRFSLKHAAKIIAVSENTKKDLIKMYGGDAEKIKVVYHGFSVSAPTSSFLPAQGRGSVRTPSISPLERGSEFPLLSKEGSREVLNPFLLSIGRLEKRKNIINLIKTFELLKGDGFRGELVLVGKPGYGYSEIKKAILSSPDQKDIIEKGYVPEEEKWQILQSAAVFIFPSFYEGFGMPLLEAFAADVPVAASNTSSLPEIGGDACVYFNPENVDDIARKIREVLASNNLRQDLIQKGQTRLANFSWQKCGRETLFILIKNRS
ncbi:MAG: glycosyltransferase family 1 protein [Patescibacteria group bacterium]|nr:glycosyltransferase family 1 protein [Patescibacteria group bacterium]